MKHLITLYIAIALFTSCKKFLEVDPPANQITTDKVFASDETAVSSVNGVFSEMMANANQFCASGITFYAGMCADELRYYGPSDRDEFINNAIGITGQTTIEQYFWNSAYKYIYACNLVIDKLNSSNVVSKQVKDALLGETKFTRAFCYFYLVNLFGDVPLVTLSDYRASENLGRTSVSGVYNQVKADLSEAAALLPALYADDERVRPTKWAALALLARVHLYLKEWSLAESFATEVINSGMHSLVSNPADVFVKNSVEAIWQLLPVNPSFNTYEGLTILPASIDVPPTYIFDENLINAIENNDLRKDKWFTGRSFQSQWFNYPTKYQVRGPNVPLTEYYMVLRLAEQYLIRSEARAQLSNIAGSLDDLNQIRSRAGLPALTAGTQAELLSAIAHERRVELAAEWGHRWFDLKRTNQVDEVLSLTKPLWQPTDALWPLPENQIRTNPQLSQNPGY
jgi:hypothetical protein